MGFFNLVCRGAVRVHLSLRQLRHCLQVPTVTLPPSRIWLSTQFKQTKSGQTFQRRGRKLILFLKPRAKRVSKEAYMQVITEHYWFMHKQKAKKQLSRQVNIFAFAMQHRWINNGKNATSLLILRYWVNFENIWLTGWNGLQGRMWPGAVVSPPLI